jgi:MFS family permease
VLEEFNLSEAAAGLAAALFVVGLLTSRFVAGRFVNVGGFKRMQAIAIASLVIVSTGYFFAASPAVLCLIRLLNGFAYGLSSNTNMTIVSSIIPKERSGEGVGYYSMAQMVSMAIGPLLAIRLASGGNFETVFAFSAFLPAIGLLFLPFERLGDLTRSLRVEAKASAEKLSILDGFVERRVLPIALFTLFAFTLHSTLMPFMSLYAEAIDLTAAAGFFFLVNAIAVLITRPFVSKRFDRMGANAVIVPGLIVCAAGFLLLSQSHSGWMLLVSAVLIGIGSGAVQPASLATVVHLTPKHRLGMGNATYFMALDSSAALGPILGGAFIPFVGYRGLYTITVVWTLAAIPIYYGLYGRKASKKK